MAQAGSLRLSSTTGRWVLFAAVLGSGMAFLDGTVVNVALPTIRADLNTTLSGLQWVIDGYLVTLSALLLLGGSLGDLFGRRRVFVVGLIGFAGASALCAIAPTIQTLVAARSLQGVAAALLVPGSLSLISASFHPDDRGRAIGAWSGLSGVTTAIGPFIGGWLIDSVSWRLVFVINVPLAVVAVAVALRFVPESCDVDAVPTVDIPGALLASAGLAAVAYALIEGGSGFGLAEWFVGAFGVAFLGCFILVEHRSPQPMLPLSVFRSRQFSGANITTLAVYTALGGATFLLVLQLQIVLGYSALEAGAALLPITVLMLFLSAPAGQLASRIGPRLPMTIGPLIIAIGLVLVGRTTVGSSYVASLLPALVVFGLGLACTVAPLTTAVLAAVSDRHIGVGSGVNNAAARVAGLLAVAMLPTLARLDLESPADLDRGFPTAMYICAALSVIGAVVALATVDSKISSRAQGLSDQ